MATTTISVTEVCAAAQRAARVLATLPAGVRNAALLAVAAALESRSEEILAANAQDLEAGRESDLSPALMDRLALDEGRIATIAAQVRDIAALPDPVGEMVEGK